MATRRLSIQPRKPQMRTTRLVAVTPSGGIKWYDDKGNVAVGKKEPAFRRVILYNSDTNFIQYNNLTNMLVHRVPDVT